MNEVVAISQFQGEFAGFHVQEFKRPGQMPGRFKDLTRKKSLTPELKLVRPVCSNQERSTASLWTAPKDRGVFRSDDSYRHTGCHTDKISH